MILKAFWNIQNHIFAGWGWYEE